MGLFFTEPTNWGVMTEAEFDAAWQESRENSAKIKAIHKKLDKTSKNLGKAKTGLGLMEKLGAFLKKKHPEDSEE